MNTPFATNHTAPSASPEFTGTINYPPDFVPYVPLGTSLPPTSVIIDLETLGRTADTIIFEIGAIAFNRSDFVAFDHFLALPCIATQLADYRSFEPETLTFHREKGSLPQSFAGDSPIDVINGLHSFLKKHKPHRIWIHGKDFDRPIIDSFVSRYDPGLQLYDYWQIKCARDAWDIAFPDPETKRDKRPHRSLPDCRATLRDLARSLISLNRREAA